ncbi:ATP-grasp domain-containing protein [Sporosarcina thermotolerans]|uniref:ATP-grasp domain-containing protein n=1 Tax=Sporosarcina thermotolerans TaxID=633404 RepID=A0AAW9A9P7_9BACL|nr:ATP-grasp domain-containing protein [Sporosarcina thermotolerans]MDW0118112.1 ATP-grasp domain-containing protein [Sporosarcina thermotolerans]WHT47608.1 ATP-grasp domain-containing protein [Sporosarcina thermotolerans]
MKGHVYYSSKEAKRNHGFIDDLMVHAAQLDLTMNLLVDNEEPDSDADFILFRDRNFDLSAKWESAGLHVINRSEVNRIANNKLKTFEFATLLGIPAVPTKRLKSVDGIAAYPVILKTVDGHGGTEVYLCHTVNEAEQFLNQYLSRQLIVQPYIESNATDIRVFMLGDEVLGAVKRIGNDGFKSNYTLGGSVEKYILSSSQEKEVRKIARALKSDYIGIDFLLLPDGSWLLNEIEDPVGARSLYATHDFSVAQKLMERINERNA